ncbi:MAG: hypothetical protein AAGB00_11590 [Planctomycetota bacterium]
MNMHFFHPSRDELVEQIGQLKSELADALNDLQRVYGERLPPAVVSDALNQIDGSIKDLLDPLED